MAYRAFRDSRGQQWDVWAVGPQKVERRVRSDGKTRPAIERRQCVEYRMPLAPDWVRGWLAFQCETERRRLAPIPVNWTELSDAELEALCDTALAAGGDFSRTFS